MAAPSLNQKKHWTERISRSGYFFGAVLLHLIVFLMVATWVIFPAFHPPTEDFTKTYLPPSAPPPPPPPPQPSMEVPTRTTTTPTAIITAPTEAPAFSVPLPDITPTESPVNMDTKMTTKVVVTPNSIAPARLARILDTEMKKWGRSRDNILDADSDPKNVVATFPVFLASYADGDWGCNTRLEDGKIWGGSLVNLVAKMNEWSHGHLTGKVVPTPLDIGGPDLLDKAPPFIFFTGHKDFILTEQEIQNLRDYLQVGGAIWGDNALAGRGSRFDVAFRREMKRVVPDLDKNFEPMAMDYDVFTKSWFPLTKIARGMNYYEEPLEHLDIDGKLAILYTPNDYSDMFTMWFLNNDTEIAPYAKSKTYTSDLLTWGLYLGNNTLFFRNYELPSCLECDKLGMNVIGYLLVRFDKDLLLTP